MKEIAKALMLAQAEMPKLINNQVNPHFRSNYATLDEVIRVAREPLAKHGIAVLEQTEYREGVTSQNLALFHIESGEDITNSLPLVCKDPQNPQQVKSAQTYARRMLWITAAGLAPEDDDGNAASEPAPKLPSKAEVIAQLKPHEADVLAYVSEQAKREITKLEDISDTGIQRISANIPAFIAEVTRNT